MNRIDATPTSSPAGSGRVGNARTADAEGHRFTWHPVQHTDANHLRVTDEKLRADVGMRF